MVITWSSASFHILHIGAQKSVPQLKVVISKKNYRGYALFVSNSHTIYEIETLIIECYFYYFYFLFYYLFLLSISFFFFDMDHWSDTNK